MVRHAETPPFVVLVDGYQARDAPRALPPPGRRHHEPGGATANDGR
ncbi:hypothetical protein ISF6_2080 [Piscinibacter sakaiensis]|uniref:Uncharacterized protein n=1 Tax=Piscinibacter sakaiensis TaxID=1547922 RepID=A0A0K8P246_PISS1|nr:hypothetical protein ISF6_2080 [Piscinibacter sakaiensis]